MNPRLLIPASLLALAAAALATALNSAPPAAPAQPAPAAPAAPATVNIAVNASQSAGVLKPIWRFFGGDEPNYATMKDGRKLLAELGSLDPKRVYFRTHNLLNTGDGTPAFKWGSTNIYTEDKDGNPIYDFTIVDLMFDTYLARGVRPYVQLGFMPQALSTQPESPYQHEWRPGMDYSLIYNNGVRGQGRHEYGWRMPPKDYAKWGELCYQWAKHCVERYGMAEVETWYWQVWNEADAGASARGGNGYWGGTPEDFYKLHDYAIAGVLRAIPNARVGGPDSAGGANNWTRDFYQHCLTGTNYATGQVGTKLDFVAFHAKGSPTTVTRDGVTFVRMGIGTQLGRIRNSFNLIATFPQLKNTPIVIGESDPEGCAACQGAALAYRNGTMYSSYTAAVFARKHDLADQAGVNLEGALTWAFEFENQPYFAGFRQISSNGIPMPVLNVFRMMAKMGADRVSATSSGEVPVDEIIRSGVRGRPDIGAIASKKDKQLAVMIWNYHDDDLPAEPAPVSLALGGLPAGVSTARLTHYRIDENHSNSYAEWKRMGSPHAPTKPQYDRMLEASNLATLRDAPAALPVANGAATLAFSLPRQAVSLVVLEWD